ncbi:methyltransferase domain-containing protein [bacterium]|nr:methyltransferase domain-containing protein [bacterium]
MSDFATRRMMMVDTQVRPQDVTKFPIIAAMLSVPRERFVPQAAREAAYAGHNLPIAPRRVVLEARSLAKLLDALDVEPGEAALDLGTGLGYAAAILAELGAKVTAVEEDPAMAALAAANLDGVAKLVTGPLTAGAAAEGPFDVILIQGAVETFPPALEAQLKEGGRVGAIFMEGALGIARIGHKLDGKISWRYCFNATAPVLPGFEARRGFVL